MKCHIEFADRRLRSLNRQGHIVSVRKLVRERISETEKHLARWVQTVSGENFVYIDLCTLLGIPTQLQLIPY